MKALYGILCVIAGLATSKNVFADVPTCVTSNPNIAQGYCDAHNNGVEIYRACTLRVRAKEYALRAWYSEAIANAQLARFIDYANADSLPQLQCYYQAFADALNSKTFAQASQKFPELGLATSQDQINQQLSFTNTAKRIQLSSGPVPTRFVTQIATVLWSDRVQAGHNVYNSIVYPELPQLSRFLEFNLTDIATATRIALGDPSVGIPCSVFYPTQFAFSAQALAPLIGAVSAFPSCRDEIYRSILVQAFTTNRSPGGTSGSPILQDSSYAIIPYTPAEGSGPTLSDPAAVMIAKIADPKLTRSIGDAFMAAQVAKNQTDISQDDINSAVNALNQLLVPVLGIDTETQIAFYKGLASYASTRDSLVGRKLGAAFAVQLGALTHPSSLQRGMHK